MKGGGGRLLIRTREATWWSGHKSGLLITVADNGTGMSGETLSKLYQAFTRRKAQEAQGWAFGSPTRSSPGIMGI